MIPLINYYFLCAGGPHRSEIVVFHALESSIAQESWYSTRGNGPPLRKCRIPRAGGFHRSENAEYHARQRSTAQESRNTTRWNRSSPKNRENTHKRVVQ